MATEDYTTYTEVDPNNRWTITTDRISGRGYENENSWIYDDKGIAHFDDFTHLLDIQSTGGQANKHRITWMLSNDITDCNWSDISDPAIIVMIAYISGYKLYISERYSGTQYDSGAISNATTYYLEIIKSGTAFSCEIYSDSSRLDLINTLSLTLGADHTFRYVFGCTTWSDIGSAEYWEGWNEKLDLQEVEGETHFPTDLAKATELKTIDATLPLSDLAKATELKTIDATLPLTDLAKATESISFLFGLDFPLADLAKATDSISFVQGLLHSLSETAKATDSLSFIADLIFAISDLAKATDSISFRYDWAFLLSDLAKATESKTIDATLPLSDLAKATDSLSFDYGYMQSLTDLAKATDNVTFKITVPLTELAKATEEKTFVPPMEEIEVEETANIIVERGVKVT